MYGINDVEVGQKILEKQEIIKKESLMNKQVITEVEEDDSSYYNSSGYIRKKKQMDLERQRECREAFDKTLMKITRVKMISSPTAKIEYISKFMKSIMPDDGL